MTHKTIRLEDLDCPHCAAEIERAVNGIENVKATLSFITQKMVLEFEGQDFDALFKKIVKIVKVIEPDVTVIAE